MYLKQIEIHGFKSFANNTILKFEKGINGIVGPNGSGKSNIADAVRWVLGERSMKQLRGAETMDVIFSGTELRKAQGFAYVNLVIDNTDRKIPLSYDEIQVSRRLYRSGESEYKLNGSDCRLKDINEVFYDTGIGKEGYSIIGQGQIDKILSNKPEDRRELFDEAVGIVKYKRRKIIAERKLEEERLNLSRVSDIINEIERQIGPLKKQAEAAKEYLNLRDDLLLYESNYFVREVDEQSKLIEDTNKNIEINKNDLKHVKEKKIAFNEKYNEIENQITKLDLEISELKDIITDKIALSENLKGQINVLKEQINSEKNTNQGRIERINSINLSIDTTINNIEKDLSKLSILKNQIEFIRTSNSEIEENEYQFNTDLNLINNCISKANKDISNVKNENYIFSDENDNKIFTDDLNSDVINTKRNELETVESEIKNQVNLINNLNEKLVSNHDSLENVNNQLMDAQNEFHSEETRLETLKNLLERYEGYLNTVKTILDNRSKFKGIKGVVADLFETQKDFEVAIEVALGNSIQNIVTDNVDSSKEIINYLKENKLGRVTTLPLSALEVKDNEIYLKAKKEIGVIDIAVNLVKYNSDYNKLAKYLFERCLIVDNYDHAKTIFNKYKSGIKLVTVQGELFNPGGAISGGAFKNSANLIGRKREYDELVTKISDLKNSIDNLNQKKLSISEEYDQNYNEIEKMKDNLNALNIKKNTITLNIINEMKLQYSNISNKAQFITDDVNKLLLTLVSLKEEIDKHSNEDISANDIIKNKEDTINKFEREIDDINLLIQQSNESINKKNELKNSYLSNRKEYYESKDKITNEQILLEQESSRLSTILEKANLKIEEITNSMYEDYALTYLTAKEKFSEDLGSSDEIKKQVKDKRKVIQELGPINVNAIEEYKLVGERYDLMTTQYEDIKKSEEMIAAIVDELDENMHKQFDENFKKIKQEFEIVFKKLFGGGKANLELVEIDEKGVLDAGVSIVVQPPGKKLGNMMQLSGGEKALTAIALLFAIQNLKPSPFCLLDEIEAALDESNVDRFAEYLHNLTNETQFIIITHRRGTMEKADRLYGITMQEKGITTIVSVDLIEDQLS